MCIFIAVFNLQLIRFIFPFDLPAKLKPQPKTYAPAFCY